MIEKPIDEPTKRASHLGFRQGYEVANRTQIDESLSKDEFVDIVLETVIDSLKSTVFEAISAELDLMNEKFPAFDGWKVFSDGVIHGAGENFSDRTGNAE